jgi:hypothetical protein
MRGFILLGRRPSALQRLAERRAERSAEISDLTPLIRRILHLPDRACVKSFLSRGSRVARPAQCPDRSARERFHKTTLTRAFRHSGGHAGPFGRVTSYIGCLVTSVVWVPVKTRMVTLAGVKSGKDTGQVPVAEVQVVLLVDPSGAVTTTVTGV